MLKFKFNELQSQTFSHEVVPPGGFSYYFTNSLTVTSIDVALTEETQGILTRKCTS